MDRTRLENLLNTHHADAFRWATHCCAYRTEDAEDVLQTVYLKITEGKAIFRERSSFKTWLFAVIRNTANDEVGKRLRRGQLSPARETAVHQPEISEGPDYRKLLAHLPRRQQQILLLKFYHEMSLSEIAEVTGLHIGTVRTHYTRGKAGLKLIIEKAKV